MIILRVIVAVYLMFAIQHWYRTRGMAGVIDLLSFLILIWLMFAGIGYLVPSNTPILIQLLIGAVLYPAYVGFSKIHTSACQRYLYREVSR